MTEEQALKFSLKKGIHAGKPFSRVPADYLRWIKQNMSGAAAEAAEITLHSIERIKQPEKRLPPTLEEVDDRGENPFKEVKR